MPNAAFTSIDTAPEQSRRTPHVRAAVQRLTLLIQPADRATIITPQRPTELAPQHNPAVHQIGTELVDRRVPTHALHFVMGQDVLAVSTPEQG